ncbi:MAG: Ig-like domain-containing protein [Eubacteriales bacterium]|nr:Ig-like domain-containing protein [Eubacteriales bacterium]
MLKKLISLNLAILMLLTLLPASALAASEEVETDEVSTEVFLNEGMPAESDANYVLIRPVDGVPAEKSNSAVDGVMYSTEGYPLTYRDVDFSVDMPEFLVSPSGEEIPATKASLPTSYSSVTAGKITPVKDQYPYGTCWSFGATNAAEASLITSGGSFKGTKATNKNLDLSELQLIYFFYHNKVDPLGNATGDKTTNLSDSILNQGGNHIFTEWALAGWTNGAVESTMPYNKATSSFNDSLAYSNDVVHLQNVRQIPIQNNSTSRDCIKQAIQNYGAVAMSYFHDDDAYNYYTAAHFTNITSTNHAVSIVGWNDNYPADNFDSYLYVNGRWDLYQPIYNGAWLVKNSWGTDWGTDGDANPSMGTRAGYFWLSYYDASFLSSGTAYAFLFEDANNYKYNYQYDGSNGVKSTSLSSGSHIGATYQVKGDDAAQSIDAVGIALESTNVKYSVQLYKVDSLTADPVKTGTELLSEPVTGTTDYAGYYTIPIPNGPVLNKGEYFSVVITLQNGGSVYVDKSYTNGDWISFTADTSHDHTFKYSGSSYTDLAKSGQTARVKAYTNPAKGATPITDLKITAPDNQTELVPKATLQLTAVRTPADATEGVVWSSSNVNVATVDQNGKVTAKAGGTVIITASSASGKVSATYGITVVQPITSLKLVDENGKSVSKLSAVSGGEGTVYVLPTPNKGVSCSLGYTAPDGITAIFGDAQEDGKIPVTISVPDDYSGTSASVTIKDTLSGKSAKCTLSIVVKAQSITLSSDEIVLQKGKTATLKATLNPKTSKETVTWSSSDGGIATVDKNGKVKAVGGGVCTITAKTDSGLEADCMVKVIEYISKMSLDQTKLSVTSGSEAELELTVSPYREGVDFDIDCAISGSGISVAQVGEVADNFDGTATITYRVELGENCGTKATLTFKDAYSKKSAKCSLTITVKATSLTLNNETLSLVSGKTATLKATLGPKTSKETVVWESDDPGVAKVDQKGKVTAVAVGTCTITAKTASGDDVCDTCEVTVTPVLNKVTATKDKTLLTISAGELVTLDELYKIEWKGEEPDEGAYEVSYTTTAKPAVGTLDIEEGTFTAAGTIAKKTTAKVTVTVRCGSQKKTCSLTITILPE